MLPVVTSHRLEDLFEALCARLAGDPLPPLARETIVVPAQGVSRWLEQRLAERFGIAAGLDLPFLGAFVARLVGADEDAPDAFASDVLALRLFRLLGDAATGRAGERPFGPASDYCRDDADGRRRLQLSQRLAAAFDGYQLYRPDVLQAFAAGQDLPKLSPHAPWQAQLWRELLRDAGVTPPSPAARRRSARRGDSTPYLFPELAEPAATPPTAAHRLERLAQRLDDPAWRTRMLPQRLSVFGATTMAPALVATLRRIAEHVDTVLYVPTPTPHYTGHLRERGDTTGENALLSRFGTESREFQELLHGDDGAAEPVHLVALDAERAAFDAESGTDERNDTLLQRLQHDVVQARDPSPQPFRHRPDDDSLRVHDCHSPQRELEVVRDQICAAFAADPSLTPRDVLVLVPDIDRYAPFAEAVFGPIAEHVPFHVADRDPAGELPICRALLRVLDLWRDRLTLGSVLHVLEVPAVQQRFGLFPSDVPLLRQLCDQAGIRWGLDADSRQKLGLVPFDDNTFRQGLDRLVLGTLTGPCDDLVAGRLPVPFATEAHAERLTRFVGFTATLFAQLAELESAAPLARWADRIDALVHALFRATDGDDEAALQAIERSTRQLRTAAEVARCDAEVPLVLLRDWLVQALQQKAAARGFLGGSVTIAAMLPMRAVPVRCLYVCGLDDASFPRRDRPDPFDLIAAERRPCDRSRRLDDRQLFLDLLLAARDRLHLSFVGRSAKDNSESVPSIVVDELLQQVDRTCVAEAGVRPRERVVVRHPLQPWSPRYDDGRDARLFTYARRPAGGLASAGEEPPFVDAAAEPATPALPREPATTRDDPTPEPSLPLDTLLEFWWHPNRFYLRHTLQLRLRKPDEPTDDLEPFGVNGLDRYRLQDDAVQRALRGERPADALLLARAQGALPVGHHGAVAFAQVDCETQAFVERLAQHAAAGRRAVDVRVGGHRLQGELQRIDAHQIYARVARKKPKDTLRGWLCHLVATVAAAARGEAPPTHTLLLFRGSVCHYPAIEPELAHHHLESLIRLYLHGCTRPLPCFENASHEAARRLAEGEDDTSALRAARKKFRGDPPRNDGSYRPTPDGEDPHVHLCWRGVDPFDDRHAEAFLAVARAVWHEPMQRLLEVAP